MGEVIQTRGAKQSFVQLTRNPINAHLIDKREIVHKNFQSLTVRTPILFNRCRAHYEFNLPPRPTSTFEENTAG